MAPVRRYLRITKSWVIEVRIYCEPPSIADSWLLKRSDPAITHVMQAIRPSVMPKLREERERAGKKGKAAKKASQDVISGDDFEASIFLTQSSSRHTLLTKSKTFEDLGGDDRAGVVSGDKIAGSDKVLLRTEDDADAIDLEAIPVVGTDGGRNVATMPGQVDSEAEDLFVDDEDNVIVTSTSRVLRDVDDGAVDDASSDEDGEDKKKFAISTTYRGFAIYGQILCVVVKRKGRLGGEVGSQRMLEHWVSTQAISKVDSHAGGEE